MEVALRFVSKSQWFYSSSSTFIAFY